MKRQIASAMFAVCLSGATIGAYAASLTLRPAVQRVEANAALQGVVTIDSPALASAQITLSSSNPAVASVPASVTMAVQATRAVFSIDVNPVTSDTAVTITASVPFNRAAFTVSFTVLAPPRLTSVSVSPTPVLAGQPAAVTATIDRAAGHGGVSLTMSSRTPTVATIPSTATVAAGSVSVSVPVATKEVALNTAVSLTSLLNGLTLGASLTVQPTPMEITAVTVPSPIISGQSKSGTVTLNHGATGDTLVTITTNNPNVTVPNQVLIRSGNPSGGFSVSATNIPAGTPSATAQVTATLGTSTRSATFTVEGAEVLLSSITLPTVLTSGKADKGTVRLNLNAVQDTTVSLVSNSANLPVTASVTVLSGQSSADFPLNPSGLKPGAAQTAATITASLKTTNKALTTTIVSGHPAVASLTVPSPLISGAPAQTAQVTLSEPSLIAETVRLSTSQGNFQIPVELIFPAGQTSGTFQISATGLAEGSGQTLSGNVSAILGGVSKTVSVTATAPAAAFAISSFTISPQNVLGGNPVTGTVNLTAPAPSAGQTVFLSIIQNRGYITVPSSFTIPAGQTSGTFQIGTARPLNSDGSPAENGPGNISARIGAQSGVQAFFNVTWPRLNRIVFTPATIDMGATPSGRVELNSAAPPGGVRVLLTCTTPDPAVPCDSFYVSPTSPQVTIAAGQTSASIPLSSTPNPDPSKPRTVTWSFVATSADVTERVGGNVTLKRIVPSLITLSSSSVRGGDSLTATVNLSEPAIANTTVGLTGTETDRCQRQVGVSLGTWFPESITIPAGQQAGNFTIVTQQPSCDLTVTVQASAHAGTTNNSFGVVSARVVSVTVSPSTIVGGQPFTVVITIDNTVPNGPGLRGFDVTKLDPEFVVTMPGGSLAVPAGQTSVTLNGTSKVVFAPKTITIGAFRPPDQQTEVRATLTVNPQ